MILLGTADYSVRLNLMPRMRPVSVCRSRESSTVAVVSQCARSASLSSSLYYSILIKSWGHCWAGLANGIQYNVPQATNPSGLRVKHILTPVCSPTFHIELQVDSHCFPLSQCSPTWICVLCYCKHGLGLKPDPNFSR